MHIPRRSLSAQRAIAALSPSEADAYDEIEYYLTSFLKAFLNDGMLLRRRTLFGRDGYVYFDGVFQYLLFIELPTETFFGMDVVLVQAIFRAYT